MTGLLRLGGLVLLFLCAAWTGIQAARGLDVRVTLLEQSIALLLRMETLFSYSLTPPGRALSQLAELPAFGALGYPALCTQLCGEGSPFPHAWRRAVEDCPGTYSSQDRQVLAQLADTLGQTDLDGQLVALEQARALLGMHLEEARGQRDGRAGLYRTLGALGGALLVILCV